MTSACAALRVGMDVAPLGDASLTGIPLYVESLLREFLCDDARGGDETFTLVGAPKGSDLPALLRARGINSVAAAQVPGSDFRIGVRFPALGKTSLVRKLDGRVLLPLGALATTGKINPPLDVFHHTGILRVGTRAARRHIVTIYDLTTRFYPETHNRVNKAEWERVYTFARDRADLVITDSESARADIVEHLHITPDRVLTIPLGVRPLPALPPIEEQAALLARLNLAGVRFVLSVGSLEPRKNLPRLIEAFARLAAAPENADLRLVLAGAKLHGAQAVADAVAERGLQNRVILPGYVSDAELVVLMRACACFAYPSVYEGFGLPVLEALAAGAPVLTSNVSSLPEVAGDAALLVDPHDVNAIAGGLARILGDAAFANDLRARGPRRAARFSWAACAARHRQAYRDVTALGGA